MEMYADEESRAGVLEPEGMVGIKYRKDKQLQTMARLDPTYGELKKAISDKSLSPEKQAEIKAKMTEREKLLLPVYSQISLQYADLHDRAGRMQAKDTIRHPLQWKNARRFFYWRLRRRLSEEQTLRKMANASINASQSRTQNLAIIQAWTQIEDFEHNDRAVAAWYEENKQTIKTKIDAYKAESVAADVEALLRSNKEAGLNGIKQLLSVMPIAEREAMMKQLASA